MPEVSPFLSATKTVGVGDKMQCKIQSCFQETRENQTSLSQNSENLSPAMFE